MLYVFSQSVLIIVQPFHSITLSGKEVSSGAHINLKLAERFIHEEISSDNTESCEY